MADIRTTGLLDDFNRADENPLSGGGNWAFNQYVSDPLQLGSNAAIGSVPSNFQGSYWTPGAFSGDMEVWGTVSGDAGENNSGWLMGFGKDLDSPTTNDGYYFQIRNPVGSPHANIFRVDNNVETSLAGLPDEYLPAAGDKLLFRRVGNALEAWYSTDGGANWNVYFDGFGPFNDTTYMTDLNVWIGVDNGSSSTPGWNDVGGGEPIEFMPQEYRRLNR